MGPPLDILWQTNGNRLEVQDEILWKPICKPIRNPLETYCNHLETIRDPLEINERTAGDQYEIRWEAIRHPLEILWTFEGKRFAFALESFLKSIGSPLGNPMGIHLDSFRKPAGIYWTANGKPLEAYWKFIGRRKEIRCKLCGHLLEKQRLGSPLEIHSENNCKSDVNP